MRIVHLINIIRLLVLILSLLALGCHAAQCALLTQYKNKTGIPTWIQAGHWQYLAWFVSLGISVLSAIAICVHAWCYKRMHVLRGDRFLGVLNTLPLFTSILTSLLIDGTEPWTAGTVKLDRPKFSFIAYCSHFNKAMDPTFPLLYQRCLLSDGTWIIATATCFFWALLVYVATKARPTKPFVKQSEEAQWGKYIPDPPASLRSSMPYARNRVSVLSHTCEEPVFNNRQSYAAQMNGNDSLTYDEFEHQPINYYYPDYSSPNALSSQKMEKIEVQEASTQYTHGSESLQYSSSRPDRGVSHLPHTLPMHSTNQLSLYPPPFAMQPISKHPEDHPPQ